MIVLRAFISVVFVICVLAAGTAAQAGSDPTPSGDFDGKLHVDFIPYVWLPTINGEFTFKLGDLHAPNIPIVPGDVTKDFDTKIGPNQYLAKLNFALMGELSVRKGNLAFIGDVINLNLGSTQSTLVNPAGIADFPLNLKAQQQIVASVITGEPSVTVFHSHGSYADINAGGRLMSLSVNANFQLTTPVGYFNPNGGASKTVTYSNFVFGTNGAIGLGKKLSFPFYFDYGPGSPQTLAYQGGLRYGKTILEWRYLSYFSGTGFVKTLNLGGPMVGYTITF
jgi:hypothetical protein